jgi:chemotaxis protein MotB
MKDQQPVIIIKKKKGGHAAHHGGAWKVAYADFVTAMMAFFLVMWLVAQSKDVKANIAGYFRDPGLFDYQKSNGLLPSGGAPGVSPGKPSEPSAQPDQAAVLKERALLAQAADHIREGLVKVPEFKTLRDQIEFTVTTEGLRIELVERSGSSFFDSGSAVLRGESVRMLNVIAGELGKLSNDVVLEGHTDSRKYSTGEGYGNWELSSDRANAARRVMVGHGLGPAQLRTVRGFADTQLHIVTDPLDPRNRRISIVVRSQAAASLENAAKASLENSIKASLDYGTKGSIENGSKAGPEKGSKAASEKAAKTAH